VSVASNATTKTVGAVTVAFKAGSNNGTIVSRYTATCTSPDGGVAKSAVRNGAAAAPITVGPLTTKKTYVCKVMALNGWGYSAPSLPSSPVIVGAPRAPTGAHATRLTAGKLRVAFTPGANNGAEITHYTASCASANGGGARSADATVRSIAVAGVTAGKTYTCAVTATNSRGVGPKSTPSPAVKA
jgi:hypothetical protein